MRCTLAFAVAATVGCEARHANPPEPGPTHSEARRQADPPKPEVALEPAAPASPFVIEPRVESYETFVDIRPRGQPGPGWHLQLRSRQLRPEWDPKRPRSDQIEALQAMLVVLHAKYPDAFERAGMLADLSAFTYPEYTERLARHAAEDPAWRALAPQLGKVGSPRLGALHGYIVQATNERRFHSELDQAFAATDLRLHLESVEKCSDARPGERNELGRWLQARGIRSRTPLPMGCLMGWFELHTAQPE